MYAAYGEIVCNTCNSAHTQLLGVVPFILQLHHNPTTHNHPPTSSSPSAASATHTARYRLLHQSFLSRLSPSLSLLVASAPSSSSLHMLPWWSTFSALEDKRLLLREVDRLDAQAEDFRVSRSLTSPSRKDSSAAHGDYDGSSVQGCREEARPTPAVITVFVRDRGILLSSSLLSSLSVCALRAIESRACLFSCLTLTLDSCAVLSALPSLTALTCKRIFLRVHDLRDIAVHSVFDHILLSIRCLSDDADFDTVAAIIGCAAPFRLVSARAVKDTNTLASSS